MSHKDHSIRIEVDSTLGVAYIQLSDEPVASTLELSEDVLVDLDAMGVAVGVEVLSLTADIPFGRISSECHVRSEVVGLLRLIRPSVQAFTVTVGSEASSRVPSTVLNREPITAP